MATEKPWLRFTRENVDGIPAVQGIYEIAYVTTEGKKLWRLGKTPDLHGRLSTRLHSPQPPENSYFRYYEAGLSKDVDVLEAELFDSYRRSSRQG